MAKKQVELFECFTNPGTYYLTREIFNLTYSEKQKKEFLGSTDPVCDGFECKRCGIRRDSYMEISQEIIYPSIGCSIEGYRIYFVCVECGYRRCFSESVLREEEVEELKKKFDVKVSDQNGVRELLKRQIDLYYYQLKK